MALLQVLKNNGFKKIDKELPKEHFNAQYYNDFYTLYIEKPTRRCNFYFINLRLLNTENFKHIEFLGSMNTYSNKINRFPKDLNELNCVLNNFNHALKMALEK